MKVLTDRLIESFDLLQTLPYWAVYLTLVLAFGLAVLFMVTALSSGLNTYIERRISGRMQSRVGCNRVGPEGLLQFGMDGLKLMLKEDIIPASADPYLFRLAPYLVFMGCFMSFAVLPFAGNWAISNINIGLFYVLSIASLAVVGVLMSGWASNNKWSLLGAIRSTAQIISYEIPVALTLLIPVLFASTLNLTQISESQSGGIFNWYINPIAYPFGFVAAAVFFIASLAELNRTPFDLPEAESELVSGYNTEYSGMRFSIFFVAEFANIFMASALFAIAFLGGYTRSIADIFFASIAGFFIISLIFKSVSYLQHLIANILRDPGNFFLHLNNSQPDKFHKLLKILIWVISICSTAVIYFLEPTLTEFIAGIPALRIAFFVTKIYFIIFIIMWIRWTLPRFRVDQLMYLCWTQLIPLAFIAAVGSAFLIAVF